MKNLRQRQRSAKIRKISETETSGESSDMSVYSEEKGYDNEEERDEKNLENFHSLEKTPKGDFVLVQFVTHKSKILWYCSKLVFTFQ